MIEKLYVPGCCEVFNGRDVIEKINELINDANEKKNAQKHIAEKLNVVIGQFEITKKAIISLQEAQIEKLKSIQ